MELNGHDLEDSLDPERYYLHKETEKTIGDLLKILGGSCEKVIRLKYYDRIKDQEAVEKKLSTYTTVDSLKNKRSQCLKKLAALAKAKGLSFADFMKH